MCVCGEKVGEIPVPDNNLRSLALNHILVVELRLFSPSLQVYFGMQLFLILLPCSPHWDLILKGKNVFFCFFFYLF